VDRYVSFGGIDSDGKACKVMERMDRPIDLPKQTNSPV
jgi:hypothetical protein